MRGWGPRLGARDRDLVRLERRLASLARARGPLRRALARIAGRLVALRGWERLGFARLADYARERAGLSARQLQDLAHVDRRLAELPVVEAALVRGELPWTKARLLARVATAADEARWVAFARTASVRALEREVRAVDRGSLEAGALEVDEDGGATDEKEWVTVRCTPRVQAKLHRARWVARRVAGEGLPPWACMEAVAAEALSALGLGAAADGADGAHEGEVEHGDAVPRASSGASWPRGDEQGETPWSPEAAAAKVCADCGALPPPHAPGPRAAAHACAPDGEPEEGAANVRAPEAHPKEVAATNACAPEVRPHEGPANVCAHHGPPRRAPAAPPAPGDGCAPPTAAGAAPALDALLADVADADPFELDARLRRAVALEQQSEAALAPLLRLAFDARLHRRAAFASFEAFARERLSLSPRKARALLRLARAAAICPTLCAAFGEGRLSWVQAQVLLPVLVLPETEPFRARWVARAGQTTVRRLEDEVDAALLLLATDRAAFLATGGLAERPTCARPVGIETSVGAEVGAPSSPRSSALDGARAAAPCGGAVPTEAETERFAFIAPRDVARLFRAVLCSVQRGLEHAAGGPVSPGRAAEWMLDHALHAWGADDPRTRREHRVFERDGWRCTVPGCSSYRNLHDHHVRFRSAGGSDELANRTTLCAFHHLRGVHAGRVRCLGEAPHGLRFELGLRPGRPPLVAYGPGERLASPSADAA